MLLSKCNRRVLLGQITFCSKTFESLKISSKNSGVYNGKWEIFDLSQSNIQRNPTDGTELGMVSFGDESHYKTTIHNMNLAKKDWMLTPAPIRGEVVRKLGEILRKYKYPLAKLISLEMGKIFSESLGEVQEAIDICDFAVGLSRTINGQVIPSERPGHIMLERYHPLNGHVGVITAFNFPVAVYFWNLAISLVCGNTNLWKPHESLSLTAVSITQLVSEVIENSGFSGSIASMICGKGNVIGELMINDPSVELISFTGSTEVGKHVGIKVANRFGKTILELGGNNAMIIDKSANLSMALRATLFSAVGTTGQRCTSLRRLYIHHDVFDKFIESLVAAYKTVKIGSPLDDSVLCGPLHNVKAVELFNKTIQEAVSSRGKILFGGKQIDRLSGYFVTPTIIDMSSATSDILMKEERFIPVLYVKEIESFSEGVILNNSVNQGLSSSLFSQDPNQIFEWINSTGSDCGIVNVNIGTSGAEIGGAFGGEKHTGGGRESGSDSWKQYMRRSTCTVNHSQNLPLAQGVQFGD
jgi:aldehyde dehydrogenase family 7 protein A1